MDPLLQNWAAGQTALDETAIVSRQSDGRGLKVASAQVWRTKDGAAHPVSDQIRLLVQHSPRMFEQLRSVLIQADGDLSDAEFRRYIRQEVEKTLAPLAAIQ